MIRTGGDSLSEHPLPKVISATDASNSFGSLIDEAAQGKSYFVITRLGKPKAVVLGAEQYKELIEEVEIAQEQEDTGVQRALKEAREDIELGRTLSLEELDKVLGLTEVELGS